MEKYLKERNILIYSSTDHVLMVIKLIILIKL